VRAFTCPFMSVSLPFLPTCPLVGRACPRPLGPARGGEGVSNDSWSVVEFAFRAGGVGRGPRPTLSATGLLLTGGRGAPQRMLRARGRSTRPNTCCYEFSWGPSHCVRFPGESEPYGRARGPKFAVPPLTICDPNANAHLGPKSRVCPTGKLPAAPACTSCSAHTSGTVVLLPRPIAAIPLSFSSPLPGFAGRGAWVRVSGCKKNPSPNPSPAKP